MPIERPALREFAMGRWEGLTAEEISALDAGAHSTRGWPTSAGYQFPDGESLARAFGARVAGLRGDRGARTPGGALASSRTAGPNRVVLCRALGIAPERILALGQDYAALSVHRAQP